MKVIILLLIPVFGFSQIKLEKLVLLDDKVELLVPSQLHERTYDPWKTKYPDHKKLTMSLIDSVNDVQLVGNITYHPMPESQLAMYKDFDMGQQKKYLKDVQILEEGTRVINGKRIPYIKFIFQAPGKKVFRYHFFAAVDGELMCFIFSCPEKQKEVWEKTADEIVRSVKIKETSVSRRE